MKRKLLLVIGFVLVLIVLVLGYRQHAFKKDEVALITAELEIRSILNEYTEAMKTADVKKLADLMSYPADMGGTLISSKGGLISRMSQAFRIHIDPIYDLSYTFSSIEIGRRKAEAELIKNIVLVGYFGQPVEIKRKIYMTFRKDDGVWKVANTGKDFRYDDSLLGKILDSALTIPVILLTVLFTLGYIDSKSTF